MTTAWDSCGEGGLVIAGTSPGAKVGDASSAWVARIDGFGNTACHKACIVTAKKTAPCSDAKVCTADTCDPAKGACVNPAMKVNSVCN